MTDFPMVDHYRYRRNAEGSRQVLFDGDIMIGGLFPVHEAQPVVWQNRTSAGRCGNIKADKGVQRMQAMLYTVQRINNNDEILKDLNLGVHILDTCSQDTYALEQTLEFIKSAITTNANKYECDDGSTPSYQATKPIATVIGAASSQVSVMVASMLRLFKVR